MGCHSRNQAPSRSSPRQASTQSLAGVFSLGNYLTRLGRVIGRVDGMSLSHANVSPLGACPRRTPRRPIVVTALRARTGLERLIEAARRCPVRIIGKRGSAFLVSSEEWEGLLETLHLQSISGIAASIRRGMSTPIAAGRRVNRW